MKTVHNPRLRARLRARRGGFTLVELTVSLLAGLIIGIAVVGLSKEVTNTFNEETRSAAAEMGLRTAIDRLRADVARAAFMSTPSIATDTQLEPAYTRPTTGPLSKLVGVRVYPGGSTAMANINATAPANTTITGTDEGGGPALSVDNNLNPDAIDITGNLTSPDLFVAHPGAGAGSGACPSQLTFENTPSILAIVRGGSPASVLASIFLPGGMTTGLARVVDSTGKAQYVTVCAVNVVASVATVNVSNLVGTAGFKRVFINPITTVRWRLAKTSSYASYAAVNNPGGTADATRLDLYRGYVDANGVEVTTPPELVAEYAVDLKFAWTYDVAADSSAPSLSRYVFDTGSWSCGAVTAPCWQRVRSVGIRLATRASIPDRTLNLAVPGAAASYLFRYCTNPTGVGTCAAGRNYTRVRTTMTEVALQNQARAWF